MKKNSETIEQPAKFKRYVTTSADVDPRTKKKGLETLAMMQNTPQNNTSGELKGKTPESIPSGQPVSESSQMLARTERAIAESPPNTGLEIKKRKRTRPTNWWAVNPVGTTIRNIDDSTVTETTKTTKKRPSSTTERAPSFTVSQQDGSLANPANKFMGRRPVKDILKDVPSRRNMTKPTEAAGIPGKDQEAPLARLVKHQEVGNAQRNSKTMRDQQGTPPRVLNHSLTQLRRGRSSQNGAEIGVEVGVGAASSAEMLIGRNGCSPKMSLRSHIEHDDGSIHQERGDLEISEPDRGASSKSQPRGKRQHGSGEILEVQTARSKFGRGRARTGHRVEPIPESRSVKSRTSTTSTKGAKQTKSQVPRVTSKIVSKSAPKKYVGALDNNKSQNKRKVVESKLRYPANYFHRS
jgi:hypothetical protein